jgi:hypothetical protein
MVVPMLAPRTIPIACLKVRILELTNTIVMMITADDESSSAVTTNPTRMLEKVLRVNCMIHLFALPPTTILMVSERLFTANKKRTSPPTIDKIISSISVKITIIASREHFLIITKSLLNYFFIVLFLFGKLQTVVAKQAIYKFK